MLSLSAGIRNHRVLVNSNERPATKKVASRLSVTPVCCLSSITLGDQICIRTPLIWHYRRTAQQWQQYGSLVVLSLREIIFWDRTLC